MVARPTRRGAPLARQHAPVNAHEYARHAEHKHAHTGERAHPQTHTGGQAFTHKCGHMHAQARTQLVTVCIPLYISGA